MPKTWERPTSRGLTKRSVWRCIQTRTTHPMPRQPSRKSMQQCPVSQTRQSDVNTIRSATRNLLSREKATVGVEVATMPSSGGVTSLISRMKISFLRKTSLTTCSLAIRPSEGSNSKELSRGRGNQDKSNRHSKKTSALYSGNSCPCFSFSWLHSLPLCFREALSRMEPTTITRCNAPTTMTSNSSPTDSIKFTLSAWALIETSGTMRSWSINLTRE